MPHHFHQPQGSLGGAGAITFLHLRFEIVFLILNILENLLYVVHSGLVEEHDVEVDGD